MPGAGGGTGGVGTGGVFIAVVNVRSLGGFLPILHFFCVKASGKHIEERIFLKRGETMDRFAFLLRGFFEDEQFPFQVLSLFSSLPIGVFR